MNIKTINTIKKIIRTPAFIYDLDDVKDRLHQTIVAFKRVNDDVKVFYSYKTNTALGKVLYNLGAGLQITSYPHLKKVLKFADGEDIFFASRELDEKTLKLLVKNHIHIIANSVRQLNLITKRFPDYPLGVRVDTGIVPQSTSFATSNLGLGIPINKIKFFWTSNIVGFHNHLASQNVDLLQYRKNAHTLIKLAQHFKARYLNIGGGFPITYNLREREIPLVKFAEAYKDWTGQLFLEPGRYLVGPAGYLFVKVVDIVGNVAVINASLFSAIRDRILSGFTIKAPILETGKKSYKIVGCSPSSTDYFGEYNLQELQEGKILTFFQAGAYSVSNDDFTGVKKPKEFVCEGRRIKAI